VVTGVTQHVGPTYYHHIQHSYGSYGDADEAGDADAAQPSI